MPGGTYLILRAAWCFVLVCGGSFVAVHLSLSLLSTAFVLSDCRFFLRQAFLLWTCQGFAAPNAHQNAGWKQFLHSAVLGCGVWSAGSRVYWCRFQGVGFVDSGKFVPACTSSSRGTAICLDSKWCGCSPSTIAVQQGRSGSILAKQLQGPARVSCALHHCLESFLTFKVPFHHFGPVCIHFLPV